MSHVYELYYKAFEMFRRVPEIKSVEDNDNYCDIINLTLQEHLTVIPRLAMGVLECREVMKVDEIDRFMSTILKSRISRRVIAEQHLALTETFKSLGPFPNSPSLTESQEFIGEVFLRCNASEVLERCGKMSQDLAREAYGPDCQIPKIIIEGHLDTTFPYILSHLEYIVGELIRNSIQALVERHKGQKGSPPSITILICEAPQHVIIRISDQGGGLPWELLPVIWSFTKGPRSNMQLKNLLQVPKMAATMQELTVPEEILETDFNTAKHESSLTSLTSRPPNLRLGMGLPMSRVYAEYWAGSLELHSLEGYGVDAFLQISKLGNKNEQLSTRATMDAI
ncbi:MAG: hypothetical protein M1829_006538 [Trizodia sp. TS-e1964]|nr:MAG: hypothetical protein M1829_006538 [Trizodia sp. TS-e1964]